VTDDCKRQRNQQSFWQYQKALKDIKHKDNEYESRELSPSLPIKTFSEF
jgi:hypothetical protein